MNNTYKSLFVDSKLKSYQHDLLGIYNWRRPGNLTDYFEILYKLKELNEDYSILEFGVHQGRSLIASALFLKSLNQNPLIYGYDSWEGFPKDSYHHFDGDLGWDYLLEKGSIDNEFLKEKALWDKYTLISKGSGFKKLDASNISSSGDFSNTSLEIIKNKAKELDLENIRYIQGDLRISLKNKKNLPNKRIGAILIDCDLYLAYKSILNTFWPIIDSKTSIYLDEYFSFKFPGARIATDEFLDTLEKDSYKLYKVSNNGDFERYVLKKIKINI